MKKALRMPLFVACALLIALVLPPASRAGNEVLGEIRLDGQSNVERTSGVWVDGQYVGYVKELTGSKKVLLLPGKHTILVRQGGYKDFTRQVTIHPGEAQEITVVMERARTMPPPPIMATVTISADPSRAAVFVDGLYAGHVGEFNGWGRAMLIAPGLHRIKIALPGYVTFEMAINPRPDQKVEIKTDLLKSSVPLDDALLAPGTRNTAPPPAVGNAGGMPGAMASPPAR